MRPLGILIAACAISLSTSAAFAQTDGSLAVGVSVSAKRGIADEASGHINPGFLWRFGHGRDGWGWEYGLGWYSAQLQEPIETSSADFGEIHVRPLLGGYGYGKRVGRAALTARMLAGYSFNKFELRPSFDDTYRRVLGATGVTTHTSNTFVLKPEVSAWVDLGRKVGMNISLGYMVARPDVTVTSSIGRDTRQVRADMLMFKVGAVYSIF